ncbi:hypothetical protein [Alloyangia pacifica]|uniref:hypothetical protein n=1 Tax=Alloyangia pacifica TaxID=311180 RepID=UPI001CFDB96C|nr:hypothetical protein [Alloyangia pacifica]
MPNTLGHIGVQTLISRGLLRDADVKWVWLACIIPDLPWIGQRIVRAFSAGVDPIDLRLYAVVQSSLVFCLLLSMALAAFSRAWLRSFALLAGGSLLHLLLDALQTKWANGVVLFAPLNWELLNFGLFWPEDWPSGALTLLGLAVAGFAVFRLPMSGADLRWPRGAGALLAPVALVAYLAGPLPFLAAAERADVHFTQTLRQVETRAGRQVEVDRGRVSAEADGLHLQLWTGESLGLEGNLPDEPGRFSVRGLFADPGTVVIGASHAHHGGLRDYASYVGLVLILGWWLRCLWRRG